jgi:hypothetical protein
VPTESRCHPERTYPTFDALHEAVRQAFTRYEDVLFWAEVDLNLRQVGPDRLGRVGPQNRLSISLRREVWTVVGIFLAHVGRGIKTRSRLGLTGRTEPRRP